MLNKRSGIVFHILPVDVESAVTAEVDPVSKFQCPTQSVEHEKVKTIPFSERFGVSIIVPGPVVGSVRFLRVAKLRNTTEREPRQGHPTRKNKKKGLECSFLLSQMVLWSFKEIFVRR